MKFFGQLVRTVVNVATLPVAVIADVMTGGGIMTGHNDGRAADTFTAKKLQQIKDDADEQ